MKSIFLFALAVSAVSLRAQSIVGTWQQTDKKTCFESELPQSETEKELLPKMESSSHTSVARIIRFDAKGRGQEGIFSEGEKKGDDLNPFKYRVNGNELVFLDKKSGIITQTFIIDELSDGGLRIHDAKQECENRTFTRVR